MAEVKRKTITRNDRKIDVVKYPGDENWQVAL